MTLKLQQRLELWQSRIDATALAEDDPAAVADKVRAKVGLAREARGTTATWKLNSNNFAALFTWHLTREQDDFWNTVADALFAKKLHIIYPTAAKAYPELREMAERAEEEL